MHLGEVIWAIDTFTFYHTGNVVRQRLFLFRHYEGSMSLYEPKELAPLHGFFYAEDLSFIPCNNRDIILCIIEENKNT